MKPPTWTPARQARSRETMERIVGAAHSLLAGGSYDTVAVAEIARLAGVSVGGFYARFSCKDALLEYVNDDVVAQLVEHARAELEPSKVAQLDARGVVARYLELGVRAFREHREMFRQVALRGRMSTDPDFRARLVAANRALHGLFRERVLERLESNTDESTRRALDVGLTAVSGAMREYILFSDSRPEFDVLEDAQLVAELTDLFCSYLRIP